MQKKGLAALSESLVNSYLDLAQRHGWVVLFIACVLVAASASVFSRIRINPSVEALLPPETPSQRALNELTARLPSSSPYYILVESPEPKLTRRLSREISQAVMTWPDTRQAIGRRDPSYFLDRRLLFLSVEDLRSLADRAEKWVEWQQCDAIPGCVNLDEKPESIDEDDLQKLYSNTPEVRAFLELLGIESPAEPTGPSSLDSSAAANVEPDAELGDGLPGDLCSKDGTVCAVQVILDGDPFDLDYAESVLARTDALFASITPSPKPAGLKLAASGQYQVTPTIKRTVIADLSRVTILSAVLLLVIIFVQFRSLRAFLFLCLPLVICGACTLGLIALIHPTLNVISAFTLAVLAGLGIDFGVHLLTHYGQARRQKMLPFDALYRTYHSLGSSMLVAAITTGCGFGALVAARFRGFSEMGVLAAMGIALALVAYLLIFPPLVLIAHRIFPERSSPLRSLNVSFVKFALPTRAVVIGGLLVACLGGVIGKDLDFEYNFRKFRPKGVSHGIDWGIALHGTIRSAVVMMSDNSDSLHKAAESIRQENLDDLVREKPPLIITPASFIPTDQANRLVQIKRLRSAVDQGLRHAQKESRAKLEKWRTLLDVKSPIERKSLPKWVHEWLIERDGRFGNFAVIYSDLSGSNARQMERLSNRIDEWQKRYPEIRFASRVAMLGAVIPGLRSDAPIILGLALLGLCIATFAMSRSVKRTLVVILPLLVAMSTALGVLVLFGLKINLYNMLIFPLAFGIGVDGAIYVIWGAKHAFEHGDIEYQNANRRAILGSTVTTMAGFGSMVISHNPGLASLGWMAVITLIITLIANLIWLFALLKWKPTLFQT